MYLTASLPIRKNDPGMPTYHHLNTLTTPPPPSQTINQPKRKKKKVKATRPAAEQNLILSRQPEGRLSQSINLPNPKLATRLGLNNTHQRLTGNSTFSSGLGQLLW